MSFRTVLMAAAGLAVITTGSLAPSRANAMPNGLPAAAIGEIDITEAVALCFYIDGWNGPGLYQCGYRLRRGFGWHGHRGGGRHIHGGGGGRRHMGGGGGGGRHMSGGGGGGRHGGGGGKGGGGKGHR